MDEALKKLVSLRGTVKASLTRFKNAFETKGATMSVGALEERLKNNLKLIDMYESVYNEISSIVEGTDLEHVHAQDRDEFEDAYYELVASVRESIAAAKPAEPHVMPSAAVSSQRIASSDNVDGLLEARVKLPVIALPTFDGSLGDWIKFRDTFETMIHTKKTLSNIEKFHYLNSAIKGEAARCIEALGISHSNYELAWDTLKAQFEDPDTLAHHHTQALVDLPTIVKPSVPLLKQFTDGLNSHILLLRSLGKDVDSCSWLINFIVVRKLDSATRVEWQKEIRGKVSPSVSDMLDFLREHSKFLMKTAPEKLPVTKAGDTSSHRTNRARSEKSTACVTTKQSCLLCKKYHSLHRCPDFLALTPASRSEKVRTFRLCYNCLQSGHRNKTCTHGVCKTCNSKHHTLLHVDSVVTPDDSVSGQPSEKESTSAMHASLTHSSTSRHVLLSTALVHVLDKQGNLQECRALLDSGSQSHFLTEEFCAKLNLPRERVDTLVTSLGDIGNNLRYRVQVQLRSRYNRFKSILNCVVIPKITGESVNSSFSVTSLSVPENLVLADPFFGQGRVDMLIGADLFWNLLCVGQIRLGSQCPLLQKTHLGWIFAGGFNKPVASAHTITAVHLATNEQLHDQIRQFWELETVRQQDLLALDITNKCEIHFQRTTKRDENGRFVVGIPFTNELVSLGNSQHCAQKRFLAVERRLGKQLELRRQYETFMKDYEALGHMTLVDIGDDAVNDSVHYYLPHHAVTKGSSTTTKLRVVFDGSAKTDSGLSLNDVQRVGPVVQDDLLSVVVRFRTHRYVFTADIAKMYRQVLVNPQQRRMQRVLWRSSSQTGVQTYELNTVTYGTASAPFLATRVLRQLGEDSLKEFQLAARAIIKDFYVDDLLTGTNTVNEAQELKRQITSILQTAGFELRKWASNDLRVVVDSGSSSSSVEIHTDKDPKTLGLVWVPEEDVLKFLVVPSTASRVTKRVILSEIFQIFDPLGLVGPATIQAKVIMQRLWQLSVSWDESLPQDVHTRWLEFREELHVLGRLTVPRCVGVGESVSVQLHGFCDASELAYGACVYFRVTGQEGVCTSNLLCAKSRVAPLKTVSLPRLELCSEQLLAQLAHKVRTALGLPHVQEYYWCDSQITLAWIKGTPRQWKTFVATRTSEIQELTDQRRWSYVTSQDNPADVISRGVKPSALLCSQLWWSGPTWLTRSQHSWPTLDVSLEDVPETRNTHVFVISCQRFELFERYSTFGRLLRITAYCLRFVTHLRSKASGRKDERVPVAETSGCLSSSELLGAERLLARMAQAEFFGNEV